jgi:hypothetical protein
MPPSPLDSTPSWIRRAAVRRTFGTLGSPEAAASGPAAASGAFREPCSASARSDRSTVPHRRSRDDAGARHFRSAEAGSRERRVFELPAAFTERPETRTELQYLSQERRAAGCRHRRDGAVPARGRSVCQHGRARGAPASRVRHPRRRGPGALLHRVADPRASHPRGGPRDRGGRHGENGSDASLVMPSVLSLRNVAHGGCWWEPFRRLNGR